MVVLVINTFSQSDFIVCSWNLIEIDITPDITTIVITATRVFILPKYRCEMYREAVNGTLWQRA